MQNFLAVQKSRGTENDRAFTSEAPKAKGIFSTCVEGNKQSFFQWDNTPGEKQQHSTQCKDTYDGECN